MKPSPHVISSLTDAQQTLEPLLVSLHRQDRSELFLSVAPGLARKSYRLVQQALHRSFEQGWYAGRRGRVSKLLIDALGSLQQALHTGDAGKAVHHTNAAADQLRLALTTVHDLAPQSRRRF
jgi:hypothetical protein